MKNIKLILLFIIISIYANANVIIVTNKNNSGVGSLRDAIANSASSDIIRFSPSLIASGSDTIKLSTEITTLNNLVIKGLYNSSDTLYISGQNITRIFTFQGTNLTLDSLVLVNGKSTNGAAINITAFGASVIISNSLFKNNISTTKGGAISFYNGSLNVTNTSFKNNSATSDGGAIYCQLGQDVSIYNSFFLNNSSSNYGGALYLGGTNTSNCSIIRSTVSNNTSTSDGGALCYNGRYFNMDSTIIKFNSAGGLYGGIVFFDLKTSLAFIDSYIDNSEIGNNTGLGIASSISLGVSTSTQSKLYVNRCTINNNILGGIYSLIYADNANSLSLVEVNYSTVTNNGSLSSSSGGIYSYAWGTGSGFSYNSNVKVKNSTVVNNSSSGNGSGVYSYGKIASSSYLEVKSSIVAHNSGVNMYSFSLSSPITSMGDNIFSNSSVIGSSGTDQLGVTVPSLNLGSLSNNGGFTKTLRPNTGSVAINLGNTIDLTNAQNGPISGRRDIGSTEWIQCIKTNSISATICQGQTYLFNSTNLSTTGTYTTSIVSGICDSIVTLNLLVNPSPTITVNSGTICSGNSFTINPSGANTYTISGGASVVSPTTNATYSITGTSSQGCVSSNTAISSVTVNAKPTVSVNSGSICSGNSFTINPSGANTYTISGGSSVVSPTANATYSVNGTSAQGCISSNTALSSVTVNAKPTITVNSGTICSGNSFTINPSGANTYTISGGSSVVSPISNVTYSVTGTSTQGCVSSNTAISSVTVNAKPTVSVNSGSICSGNSFTINPTGANTYTISGGSSVVTPTSNTTYSVTGTSAQGCVSSNTAISSVTVNSIPVVSVNSGSICSGNSFTINPTGANTYTISGGLSVVSPTSNTTYSVTGTSAQGCLSSNTAISSVTVHAKPIIAVNSGSICSGSSFTINPSGANTYTVSGGSSIVTPTSNATYSVTGTNTQGCLSSNTAVSSVTVNTKPTITVNSGSICSGNSFTINPTGTNTYTISGGLSVVSPTSNATYSVTGTSAQGCVSSNTAISSITVNSIPVIAVNSGSICSGNSFTINPTGVNTYTISGGSSVVSPTSNTSYSVTGTSAQGCLSSNTAVSSVTVNPLPNVTAITNNSLLCTGQTASLSANGALTYLWNTSATTSVIAVSPTVTTNYTVTGTDAIGCSKSVVLTQSVSACTGIASITNNNESILIYPNPSNGVFTISGLEDNTTISIYNAIGELVKSIQTDNSTTIDLSDYSNGIYFIKIKDKNGETTSKLIKQQ